MSTINASSITGLGTISFGVIPNAPQIVSVNGDQSSPASDTDITPEIIVGNVQIGDTVDLYIGGALVDSAVASDITVTFTPELGIASHSITAKTTRETYESAFSTAFIYNLTIATPVIDSVNAEGTSPASSTEVSPDVIVSNVEVDDEVEIYLDGVLTDTVSATDSTITISLVDLPIDSYSITVKILRGGASSSLSTAFVYNLIPITPAIESVGGEESSPATANNATPDIVITEILEGDTVKVYDGETLIATEVADAVPFTITLPTLTEAEHSLTVTSTKNSMVSSASTAFLYTHSVVVTYGEDITGAGTATMLATKEGSASDAFDNNAGTFVYWDNYPEHTVLDNWLKYDLGSGNEAIVRKYTMLGRSAQPQTAPTVFTFEGSNDNSTWDVLDTHNNDFSFSNGVVEEFTFSNSTAYRYYRIHGVTVPDGGSTLYFSLAEVQMMEAI